MKENDIQNQILDYLSFQKGVYFYRTNNFPRYDKARKLFFKLPKHTPKGIPDIHAIYKGRYIAIEVKKKGSYLSPDQRIFQKNVEAAGGIYRLARDVTDVQSLFED